MKKIIILLTYAWLFSCSPQVDQVVKIEIKTDLGSIIAELYPQKAPVTTENFLRYIREGKMDDLNFYRVVRMDNQPNNDVKIEVVQGGLGPDITAFQYPPIKHETTQETGILHEDGVISMARYGPGTATSEFFICVGDQPELDFGGKRNPDGQGFAAFGRVVEGMDVVREIQRGKDASQILMDKVVIRSVTILGEQ